MPKGLNPETKNLVTSESLETNYALTHVSLAQTLREFAGRVTGVLAADQGYFVYKFDPSRDPDEVERAAYILEFLEHRSFDHAPQLINARDGSRSVVTEAGTITVMEKVEGATPEASPENYRQLGEILGRLNSISDYPIPCPITLKAIRPEFSRIAARLPASVDQRGFLALADGLPDLDALPKGLIHFDMTLGNTIQRPDGTIVAVDWDDAGIGARVLDAGKPLISSFVSEDNLTFDEAGARAFYDGYATAVELSAEEKTALFDAALFHALRYVVWGDMTTRWRRIQWAVEHRQRLMSAVQP